MKTFLAALSVALFPAVLPAQEICNNGIDDDGDGLIDLNDPDCPCSDLISGTPSFIPNPSFEERHCCPLTYNFPGTPYFNCAMYWQQATIPTTDYFHSCGLYPDFFPLPPPDGTGFVGMRMVENWQEYIGACLMYPGPPSPLLAGVEYTLSVYVVGTSLMVSGYNHGSAGPFYAPTPIPLALYGHPVCVPFPVQTLGCPVSEGWTELASMEYHPSGGWDHLSFTFTPTVEMQTVMFGTGCVLPSWYAGSGAEDAQGYVPYLLLDNLHLTAAVDQAMVPVMSLGSLCADNAVVIATPPADMTDQQWYLDGVALPGQTSDTLYVSALGLGNGTYTLAGTYDGECLMGSTQVMVPDNLDPLASIYPAAGCSPLTVAFADTSIFGTTTELWDLGDGTTSSDSALTHVYTVPGTYDVRLRIRNGHGCLGDTLIVNAVTVHPVPQAGITVQPNPAFSDDPTVVLTATGDGNIVSWWWDLDMAQPGTSDQASVEALFPDVPGDYPVVLAVTSGEGCIDTVRSIVRVIEPGVIEMPNVFTPNGDGQNDRFIPIGYNGTPGLLEIYNRWGQLIFTTRDLAHGWNGVDAPDGTYYYIVIPDDPDLASFSGHVTLVR